MNIEGIVIMDGSSSIPLFSQLDESIDDALFSAFLTAIQTFSKELNLGGLSSFTTDEKSVFLLGRSSIVVALISPMSEMTEKLLSLGLRIASEFESRFQDIIENGTHETTQFSSFSNTLDDLLSVEDIPFLVRATEFVRKEYGGEISVDVEILDNTGAVQQVDIISQRGEKKSGGIRNFVAKRMMKGFSEDISFIKVIDGPAGKQEVLDFIDSMQKFGNKAGDSEKGYFPYFPSRCIVIAKEYSPTLVDELSSYPRQSGKAYISGSHIMGISNMKVTASASKCFIELWRWVEGSEYPEIYFS